MYRVAPFTLSRAGRAGSSIVDVLHGLDTYVCTSEITYYCWVELEAYVLKTLVMCSGFLVLWACVYKLNLSASAGSK